MGISHQVIWLHALTAVLAAIPPTLVGVAAIIRASRNHEKLMNGHLKSQMKEAVKEMLDDSKVG